MKKLVTSVAALSMAATSAFSGSLVEPEMEPMVEVMEEEKSSSGGLLLPLLALVAIGVLLSHDDDEECEGKACIVD